MEHAVSGWANLIQRGKAGRRAGVPLINMIPKNCWKHLCITFKQPLITTYVDGKKVASAKWDFPVQCNDLRLGGWGNKVCHSGLMDDLRIYDRSLTAKEVESIAALGDYSATEYSVRASRPLPSVIDFANRYVSMSIDKRGDFQN